jgi:hypothetical protein
VHEDALREGAKENTWTNEGEEIGVWRRLHIEELDNAHSSQILLE